MVLSHAGARRDIYDVTGKDREAGERVPRIGLRDEHCAAETSATVGRPRNLDCGNSATKSTAYTAMLWAAVACAKHGRVDTAHIRRPITGLLHFCRDGFRRVELRCRREADYYTVITFDGSLTGGGANYKVGFQHWRRHGR